MSLSISQKLAPKTKWYEKLLIAYGITDEIFAISMSQTRALTFSYMMGVIVISVFGWVSGTFVGGIASSLLPVSVMDAFGIALYGMFIAIVIPAIKKNRNNRIAVMIALVLSTFFYFSSWLSEGWSIIVITVGVSALMAWLCPIDQKEEAFVDGLEGNAGDDDHDVRDPA
nr:AzlC family ABC transporter permease [Dubosiella newyorkensis]